MKKIIYVALMAMVVLITACQQSKEGYIKEFESFVEEIAEECADYTEEQWEDVAEEFELLVKKAEKYQDLTAEDKLELAKVQANYAGLQAKKSIDKVIDGVKDLFDGKKNK